MTLLTTRPAAASAASRAERLGALVVPGALLALVTTAVVSMAADRVAIVDAIQLIVTLR
jgi:hypothetical protein